MFTNFHSLPTAFALNDYFDVIIESSIVGVRKPHPRIFEIALEKLSVSAKHCIYLDDIGMNLKAPRAMVCRNFYQSFIIPFQVAQMELVIITKGHDYN